MAGPLVRRRSVSLPLEILAAVRVPPVDLGSISSREKEKKEKKKKEWQTNLSMCYIRI